MYSIDFIKLLIWLIPVELQVPIIMAYTNCLIIPVRSLYQDFLVKREDDLYRLSHNSQVCYLRAVLNDKFDPVERRIRLANGSKLQSLYVYTRAENTPQYLPLLWVDTRADYGDTGVDFYVLVPGVLETEINIYSLTAQIEFYVLATKRYKIIFTA